jgi:hypothetical protein
MHGIMPTSLITPDFGSSVFPLRSASGDAPTVSPPTRRKRVRFARQLTDEYQIAPRKCKRGLSTSTEEIGNRVLRLRRQILFERETIDLQSRQEADLFDKDALLFEKYANVMTILQFKKSIASLEARQSQLDDEIFNMRMEILRTKSVHETLLKKTLIEKESSEVGKDSGSPPYFAKVLLQSLWQEVGYPIPYLEGTGAA